MPRRFAMLLLALAVTLLLAGGAAYLVSGRDRDSPSPLGGSTEDAERGTADPPLSAMAISAAQATGGADHGATPPAARVTAAGASPSSPIPGESAPVGESVAFADPPPFGMATDLLGERRRLYELDDAHFHFRRHDVLDAAVLWLEAHQGGDGGWAPRESETWCHGERSVAAAPASVRGSDVATSALAVLALLGTGRGATVDKSAGGGGAPKSPSVRGLEFLVSRQTEAGLFLDGEVLVGPAGHVLAALALAEGAGATHSPSLGPACLRALERIADGTVALPFEPAVGEVDTTAWFALTLHTARLVDRPTSPPKQPPLGIKPEAAAALRIRLLAPAAPQQRPATDLLVRLVTAADGDVTSEEDRDCEHIVAHPPTWSATADAPRIDDWFISDLGLLRTAYPTNQTWTRWNRWETWHTRMIDALERAQRRDTDTCRSLGSWDPVGDLGAMYGRAGMTALSLLAGNAIASHYDLFVASR